MALIGGITNLDEEQLWLAQARQGDKAAFGNLIANYQTQVYNLAYRMLNNAGEAEEAAQESFIRAYTHLQTFDPERRFRTWLLAITSNYCVDLLRKRRLLLLSLEGPLPPHRSLRSDDSKGPEAQVVKEEHQELVQSLLQRLPPDHRQTIVLRYWHDMSLEEIAEVMDSTVSAIKSRLFRARRRLADVATAYGLGSGIEPLAPQALTHSPPADKYIPAQPAVLH